MVSKIENEIKNCCEKDKRNNSMACILNILLFDLKEPHLVEIAKLVTYAFFIALPLAMIREISTEFLQPYLDKKPCKIHAQEFTTPPFNHSKVLDVKGHG